MQHFFFKIAHYKRKVETSEGGEGDLVFGNCMWTGGIFRLGRI